MTFDCVKRCSRAARLSAINWLRGEISQLLFQDQILTLNLSFQANEKSFKCSGKKKKSRK